MILMPNIGKAMLSTSVERPFPVAHPGFLYAPDSEEDIDSVLTGGFYRKYLTVKSGYDRAPLETLNAILCSEWELNVSLTMGAAVITETDLAIKYTGAIGSDVECIADKAGSKGSHSIQYDSGSVSSGTDAISCTIAIGGNVVLWEQTDKVWTVPLVVDLSVSTSLGVGRFAIGLNNLTSPYGTELPGVIATFCGTPFKLYDILSPPSAVSPTGAISLVPKKWLTITPLPVP